jgi:hypothetical protein
MNKDAIRHTWVVKLLALATVFSMQAHPVQAAPTINHVGQFVPDQAGAPSTADVGLNSWTVQVDDGNGGSDTATLNVTVDAAFFVKKHDWHDGGTWLMGDTHIHTTTSDGSDSVDTVASQANSFGCDFIAFSNHHQTEDTNAVNVAQAAYPNLIILQGTEWRIPSNDRSRVYPEACIFVPFTAAGTSVIDEFNDTYDGYGKTHSEAIAGLEWLDTQLVNGVKPIAIINHPSKNDGTYTMDHLRDYYDAGEVCVGISGAPGHQKNVYGKNPSAHIDGNDIMTAEIGHFTDTMLDEGREWWIRAPSDFHNVNGRDYYPGDYSENNVYCDSKTAEGIIRGYRAGCMYYTHADIISALDYTLSAGGITAMMGEKINLNGGNTVTINIRVKKGSGVTMDHIEIISNAHGSPASIKTFDSSDWTTTPDGWLEMSYDITVTNRDAYFRIRGESSAPSSKWFYSNPIRVTGTGI